MNHESGRPIILDSLREAKQIGAGKTKDFMD
jgi:hypothetical protein